MDFLTGTGSLLDRLQSLQGIMTSFVQQQPAQGSIPMRHHPSQVMRGMAMHGHPAIIQKQQRRGQITALATEVGEPGGFLRSHQLG